MSGEEIDTLEGVKAKLDSVLSDTYAFQNLYDKWNGDRQFVQSQHTDLDVESSAPNAGDLDAGEVRLGDGTGSGGTDEIFFSVDGNTVARVEADSIIS